MLTARAPWRLARAFFCSHVYYLLSMPCVLVIATLYYNDVGWKTEKIRACSRKLKKARVEEESKLGAFMKNYLTARSASTVSIDSDLVVADFQVMPAPPHMTIFRFPATMISRLALPILFYLFSQKIRFSIQSPQW